MNGPSEAGGLRDEYYENMHPPFNSIYQGGYGGLRTDWGGEGGEMRGLLVSQVSERGSVI